MLELRWAVSPYTSTKAPRLQYRQCPDLIQFGCGSGWSEWQDVPCVGVKDEPPKPAPTALLVIGSLPDPSATPQDQGGER